MTSLAQSPVSDPNGEFSGTLKLEPLPDGINMAVLETYSYTDAEQHTLSAVPGFKTDGASIPRVLWSIVGSPYTGKYLGAAVIHDVGCDTHKYSWQITHRMFYTAMRRLGVSDSYAKLLYWGVRLGGPRWGYQIIYGDTPGEVQNRIQSMTGTHIDPALIEPYEDTQEVPNAIIPQYYKVIRYRATIGIEVAPTRSLSSDDVNLINSYITNRSASPAGAVTLDEIDARTPFAGPAPGGGLPF